MCLRYVCVCISFLNSAFCILLLTNTMHHFGSNLGMGFWGGGGAPFQRPPFLSSSESGAMRLD